MSNSCQNGGTAVTCLFMVCALKDFKVWRFHSHFEVAKGVYEASKWHSCAKNGFVAAKHPAEWSFGCEIGNFHALELRSHFTAAKWGLLCYESGTRVPNLVSQTRKFSQRSQLSCEMISQRTTVFAETR